MLLTIYCATAIERINRFTWSLHIETVYVCKFAIASFGKKIHRNPAHHTTICCDQLQSQRTGYN